MSSVATTVVNDLLHFPEHLEKLVFPSIRTHSNDYTIHETKGGISSSSSSSSSSFPVDILDTPKEYLFYVDVPGIPKTDIQVTVEDDNILVIKNGGKRKREEGDEEDSAGSGGGVKYIRLERRNFPKLVRKFRLPQDANVCAILAKCEDGVLTVSVEKLPPPPKPKTVQVSLT